MAINPIEIPSAAGLNYGSGDVRHLSEGDELGVVGLANPTRQLAERDNLLASKINEVVATVNNKEQFVPLPVLRTNLPPLEETLVTNYRIPAGFEVRVLNASVASQPSSTSVELNILFSSGFGGSTGEAAVSTSGEFTSGTKFYQEGEFIVVLKNKGSVTLDAVASILFTMRPVGSAGSLLVGSTIKGEKGEPGKQGVPGPAGPAGTGGAGSPGMVWRGGWTARPQGYQYRDAVSVEASGTLSSFFCKVSHAPSDATNSPPSTTYWDYVARGAVGATGATGATGPAGGAPTLSSSTINGTFKTGADYVGGSTYGDYTGGGTANTTYLFQPINEFSVQNASGSPVGMAFLTMASQRVFKGSGTFTLPQTGVDNGGGKANYDTAYIHCAVMQHSGSNAVKVTALSATKYAIEVKSTVPESVQIRLSGVQTY